MVMFRPTVPRLDTSYGSAIGDGFYRAGKLAQDYGNSVTHDQNVKQELNMRQSVQDQAVADKNAELGGFARAGVPAYPSLAKETGYDPSNPNVFTQNRFGNAVKAQVELDRARPDLKLFEGEMNYGTFNPKTGETGKTNVPVYRKPITPSFSKVDTADGVFMVNNADPMQRVRLGDYANKGQYRSVNTGDGVFMVNTSNPADRIRLGEYAPRPVDPWMQMYREAQSANMNSQVEERDRKAREAYVENAPYDVNDFNNAENDYAYNFYKKKGYYPGIVDKPGFFTGDTFDGFNAPQKAPTKPEKPKGPYAQYADGTTGSFNGKRGTIVNGYFIENGQ
ncbi:hypothetical protein WCX49_11755 [Sulfurimonas sp. HSL-1656]|uniref:hypothetical protein n=1 Tax=Thiomicrolovo subterrani TaxID=3131934 RepID=UPI0031F9B256